MLQIINKRFGYMICLLLMSSIWAFGQQHTLTRPPNPEIRALKIKVVTQNMHLKPAQKGQFLALYTKYSNELLVIYRQKHALRHNNNSSYVVNQRIKLDKEIVDIKSDYTSKFLKIISPKQLEEMYQGEDQFKQLLIQRLRHRHN